MKQKTLFIMMALFVLTTCLRAPAVTFKVLVPDSVTTATPIPPATGIPSVTPTPWLGGTETAVSATEQSLPGSTQEIFSKPSDFSPVLYGGDQYGSTFFILLGGVSKSEWLSPETSVTSFSGAATYSLSSMQVQARYFVWGEAPEFSPTCKTFSIRTEADPNETGFVAVLDGWTVNKRDVTELANDSPIYATVVSDWLKAEGVSVPELGLMQVFRVDLEGDGSDEIFISATRLDGSQHMTRAGDYSVVLMRKVIGNDVVTKLVVGDIYRSAEPELTFPRTYSLANFIDLNQDGVLEVVVDTHHWEGFGAIVYQVLGQQMLEVLRAEC